MLLKSVENKTIIITGASGGIGRAILNRLSGAKNNIIAVYNKNHPHFQNNKNLIIIKADLTKSDEWDKVLQFSTEAFGRIDILINCTGVLVPGNFLQHSEDQITGMINSNFSSILIGTHKFLGVMMNQGFGHIIILGSAGGIIPMPYSSVYSATKFALRGFVHSLKEELRNSNISVSLISPGPVKTKMLDREAMHKKTAIAFISKAIKPGVVADAVSKVIRKPKTEVILPPALYVPARLFFCFPRVLSSVYSLIEKIGIRQKRHYLQKQLIIPVKN